MSKMCGWVLLIVKAFESQVSEFRVYPARNRETPKTIHEQRDMMEGAT